MQITKKPWGREELIIKTEKYAAKHLFVNKGEKLSLQYHNKKLETYFILSGKCIVQLDEKEIELSFNDTITIPPKTKHRVTALTQLVILEVSTPELNDIVRLSDEYNRI